MVSPLFPVTGVWTDLDRLVNRTARDAGMQPNSRTAVIGMPSQPIPLDVYSTDDHAVITAALPGVHPEDLDLKVHQNQVTISGAVANTFSTEDAKGATWLAKELWSGQFRRSITLPFAVEVNEVTADFDHGVLRITLPRAESAKPRSIAITTTQPKSIEDSSIEAPALTE